jgi:hypothetical protein
VGAEIVIELNDGRKYHATLPYHAGRRLEHLVEYRTVLQEDGRYRRGAVRTAKFDLVGVSDGRFVYRQVRNSGQPRMTFTPKEWTPVR